jgi:hypothetical protein
MGLMNSKAARVRLHGASYEALRSQVLRRVT